MLRSHLGVHGPGPDGFMGKQLMVAGQEGYMKTRSRVSNTEVLSTCTFQEHIKCPQEKRAICLYVFPRLLQNYLVHLVHSKETVGICQNAPRRVLTQYLDQRRYCIRLSFGLTCNPIRYGHLHLVLEWHDSRY